MRHHYLKALEGASSKEVEISQKGKPNFYNLKKWPIFSGSKGTRKLALD